MIIQLYFFCAGGGGLASRVRENPSQSPQCFVLLQISFIFSNPHKYLQMTFRVSTSFFFKSPGLSPILIHGVTRRFFLPRDLFSQHGHKPRFTGTRAFCKSKGIPPGVGGVPISSWHPGHPGFPAPRALSPIKPHE